MEACSPPTTLDRLDASPIPPRSPIQVTVEIHPRPPPTSEGYFLDTPTPSLPPPTLTCSFDADPPANEEVSQGDWSNHQLPVYTCTRRHLQY